ncbi:helix-turn-helix domain-containing protein, partial [Bacteroides sp. OttesenSCG-928-D19]|nr:helix-turn-helix domain-containing protein [Bacteroides sp. OttesenSCG-928-D19]
LSISFLDEILKGKVIVEATDQFSMYDEFMIKNWLRDINESNGSELVSLEMCARLLRMSISNGQEKDNLLLPTQGLSLVEQIAIYIAQNYFRPLSVSDIGKSVGLHPDYANSIFKKVFGYTLHEYIIRERIAHAQRKLVLSELSITEIAFDCGFNSINRFNAAFYKL